MEEAEKLSERLTAIGDSLLLKYPELNSYIDTLECQTCSVDKFFEYYYAFTDTSYINKRFSCRWGPYIATLIGCTKLGPILYWPCAYAAMCGWCSGGIADDICSLNLEKVQHDRPNHDLTWANSKHLYFKIPRS